MLCLLLVLILFILTSASIIPSDVYTDNIVFEGKTSTQQVMTFTCSETNSQGTLIVGNYVVNVTCNNPVSNYDLTEIARIPAAIGALQTLACLVTDVSAYNQALLNQADSLITATLSSSARRRLLQTDGTEKNPARRKLTAVTMVSGGGYGGAIADGVGIGLGIYSSVVGTEALEKANEAYDLAQTDANTINQLTTQTTALASNVTILAGELLNLNTYVQNITTAITLLDIAQVNTTQAIRTLQAEVDVDQQTIKNLAGNTTAALNTIQGYLINNITSLANFVNTQVPNATAQAIAQVSTNLLNITQSLQTQVNQILQDLQVGFNAENSVIAAVEDLQSNRILLQGLTSQVQSLISLLPEDYFPFTTDPGVVPSVLTGENLRNLQEIIDVNYVTPQQSPISTYEVHNVQMNFYLDTGFGLQQQILLGTFQLPIETMLQYFSSDNCTRSYIAPDWNGPLDTTPDGTTCLFYIEVVDTYCNSFVKPYFSWGYNSTLPALAPYACGGAAVLRIVMY